MGDEPTRRTMHALGYLTRLDRAVQIAEATTLLMEAVDPFGIKYYAAWVASDPCPDLTEADVRANLISNWPDAWRESYITDQKYRSDPVFARGAALFGSFFWHELDPMVVEASDVMKGAANYGMVDGFTVSWPSLYIAATAISLAGGPLVWTSIERSTITAIADTFIQRCLYLKKQGGERAIQRLSPQEQRILSLCAQGASDKEIMRHLNVQRGTILVHWSRIRSKLGVMDRTQAVAAGISSHQIVV